MPLAMIIDRIDAVSDDVTIYVTDTCQLSPATMAVAVPDSAGGLVPSGMRYLLEVPLAREAIKVWSDWRGGCVPELHDKVEAVIYYAEHDAYMPTG